MIRLWHSALIIASFNATSVMSENFGNFFTVKDNSLIVLSGNLTMRSATNFKNALASQQNTRAVVLESGGGTVASALEIAKIVQKKGLITFVPEGSYCASACSIIFFSGKQRLAEGKLGVHQMSSTGPVNLSGFQFLLADVMSAFDSFDVDDRVMQVMLRTPPEEMYFFSEVEKQTWQINKSQQSLALNKKPSSSSFDDYPTQSVYNGTIKLPSFDGRDKWARMYRTAIREGMKKGPNFSGHYSFIKIGCGTGCSFGYIADVKTGKVFSFPYGGEQHYQMFVLHSADTNLMRVNYRDQSFSPINRFDEPPEIRCRSEHLLWQNENFRVIKQGTYRTYGYSCNSDN